MVFNVGPEISAALFTSVRFDCFGLSRHLLTTARWRAIVVISDELAIAIEILELIAARTA